MNFLLLPRIKNGLLLVCHIWFNEQKIPTKATLIQMDKRILKIYKEEIKNLLKEKLN